jgi:glycosyltransferase involved in cell wall biosynthesis
MRIVIAVVSSTSQLSGVTRHAANMARCLLTRSDVSAVHMLVAQWQYDCLSKALPRDDARLHLHFVSIGTSAISRNLWYYSKLPALAAQLEADVVHLSYPVPLKGRAFQCRTIVSLHDLYPYDIPENFGFPKVLFNRLILKQCLNAVDAIACVSESTLGRLDAHNPQLALQKAVTIYNCVEHDPSMASNAPQWHSAESPFLLCVAQHRRNKNILLALKIFQRLLREKTIAPTTLFVLIGIEGPETSAINQFIVTSGLTQQVVLVRGVSDAELQWCYKNCELLLAPSSIEGFGLPVAEALLAGCPVVCSDIPAFRELSAGNCHYVRLGPSAEKNFTEAIYSVRREPRKSPITLPRLSAPIIAEDYVRLYQKRIVSSGALAAHIPSFSTGAEQKGRSHD